MKDIEFIGSALEDLKDFPAKAKREAGYQLDRVQNGLEPTDWKPMKTIGAGVKEIRIKEGNQYRVIYIAKHEEAVYVLHAFEKKTQRTAQKDIDSAKAALKALNAQRRKR